MILRLEFRKITDNLSNKTIVATANQTFSVAELNMYDRPTSMMEKANKTPTHVPLKAALHTAPSVR